MGDPPSFFVPFAKAEQQESAYAELAAFGGCPIPSPDQRIYSITYAHDGVEWVATVGEQLRGTRRWVTRSKGKKIDHQQPVSDPATVLAIFPGNPHRVVTNHRLAGNLASFWENPFMARPKSVTFFS